MIKYALAVYSFEKAHKNYTVFVRVESEWHLWLSSSLLRWVFDGLFSATKPWGIFFFFFLHAARVRRTWLICFLKTAYDCSEILFSLSKWTTSDTHTDTDKQRLWKESDEGLRWQAEEAAAAVGRVWAQRRMEGGGGRGRKFKTVIYQLDKSRLVTTDIHHLDRQTDLQALQLFQVLSVNQGGTRGSFITIFSLVTAGERWNACYSLFKSSSP